jgi:phi LC3 family holin
MINWKVRFRNKLWVTSVIAQLFLLVEILLVGAHQYGLTDFQLTKEFQGWVFSLVNGIFAFLAALGIVTDPTTAGVEDSVRAKQYDEPKGW